MKLGDGRVVDALGLGNVKLSLAVQNNLHVHQMDVVTEFLNANLDEEIYMEQPGGTSDQARNTCCVN